jgi:hypothetical protein
MHAVEMSPEVEPKTSVLRDVLVLLSIERSFESSPGSGDVTPTWAMDLVKTTE